MRSIDGMTMVFVLYDWTTTAILIEPVENTKSKTLVHVFKDKIDYLAKRSFKPKFNIMDNAASKAVRKYLEEENISLQLVKPHNIGSMPWSARYKLSNTASPWASAPSTKISRWSYGSNPSGNVRTASTCSVHHGTTQNFPRIWSSRGSMISTRSHGFPQAQG